MDYVKKAIWGPDPKEQQRKIRSTLRRNGRSIDRSLRDLSLLQTKTQQLIKKSAKKNDVRTVKLYARELYQINKQYSRMYTSKAQLDSVGMKIEEAFRMKMLSNQMADSATIMSEMVDDTMENVQGGVEETDEEIDEEVEKIVEQYTNDKFEKIDNTPSDEPLVPETKEEEQEIPEDQIDEEADHMLNEMKERLKALQN